MNLSLYSSRISAKNILPMYVITNDDIRIGDIRISDLTYSTHFAIITDWCSWLASTAITLIFSACFTIIA